MSTAVYSQPYLNKSTVAGWRVDCRPGSHRPMCDCGQPATHEVILVQLTQEQNPVNNALALCTACLAEFIASDKPLAVYPLTAPINERGIIQQEQNHESTECLNH